MLSASEPSLVSRLTVEDIAPGISPVQRFETRPGTGLSGRQIQVRANYMLISQFPGYNLIHYDVLIDPDVPPVVGRKVFALFESTVLRPVLKYGVAFDGRKNMYTVREIPGVGDEPKTHTIDISEENEARQRSFTIRIKKVATVNMELLSRFIQGDMRTFVPFETIQALDIILRHQCSLKFNTVGRSLYTDLNKKSIGGGIAAWPGYHLSVRPAKKKLLLNLDVSVTTYYESGPAVQVLCQLLNKTENQLRHITEYEFNIMARFFRGTKVEITYRGDLRRKYRVVGITDEDATSAGFYNESAARKYTVAEYFREQFGVVLRFPFLPCFRVGSPKKAVLIPIEVCNLVPGIRYTNRLTDNQRSEMIKVSTQSPNLRSQAIMKGLSDLELLPDNQYMRGKFVFSAVKRESDVTDFGIRVSGEMLTARARVLSPPTVQYNASSQEPKVTTTSGSWNMKDKMVLNPRAIRSWAVLVLATKREVSEGHIDRFFHEMLSTARSMGIDFVDKVPPFCTWIVSDPNVIDAEIAGAYRGASRGSSRIPAEVIFCILPRSDAKLYGEIKRVGDTVVGVPTQCMISGPNRQYCANVLLKVNVKLGGVNSQIAGNLPFINEKATIVFGADVTHPGPTESNKPSICSLVGSINREVTRYAASLKIQKGGKEIITELKEMVVEIMREFYRHTKLKPSRIVYFRDGVSEGQFQEVAFREISAIRLACATLEKGYSPDITFIIVQKRHHVRFFPTSSRDADRNGNILPGTVIDQDVTHPTEYDYFLCTHGSIQGTSRPTHYYVLLDENKIAPDTLYKLVYGLSFTFARATKSVSVCTPVYYADLLAFRGRFYVRNYFDETSEKLEARNIASFVSAKPNLKTQLFYL